MGKLIEGKWFTEAELEHQIAQEYAKSGGQFQRANSKAFRNWITEEGQPGISGDGGFPAEANRYHLYAAINCPWAHRTLIYRKVKGLESVVGLSLVRPLRTDQGWVFDNQSERFKDDLFGAESLYELYQKADPQFTGRVTVPVLWDKQRQTIVSHESSEIIRMFNSAFNSITGNSDDFYLKDLAPEIDELNDYIYNNLNNGVYKTGFARTQAAYEQNVWKVFEALDTLEQRLTERTYLTGEQITEADWRLLPTLVRFDVAYFQAFKCNLRMLRDYPQLSRYLNALYRFPGVAETVDLDVYQKGYNSKSPLRNPHGIAPVGPVPFYEL